MMSKNKKSKFKRLLKNHFILTIGVVVFYVMLGYFLGWNFLAYDLKSKGRVAGSTVSALMRIIGPPVTPVLGGSSACSTENETYIYLTWNPDPDAGEYDIYRNKELLMSGVVDNSWSDFNVFKNRKYTYYVIAKGPEGTAVSEELTVIATKCVSVANPKVWMEKINDKVVDNSGKKPEIKPGRPLFVGQTNISKAVVDLQFADKGDIFYATAQANNNGYWSWVLPKFLDVGEYNLDMKAVDFKDEEVFARNSLAFLVVKKNGGEEDDIVEESDADESPDQDVIPEIEEKIISSKKNKPKEPKKIIQSKIPQQSFGENEKPFDFVIEFSNEIYIKGVSVSEEVYRGENMQVDVLFSEDPMDSQEAKLIYIISSLDQEILFEQSEQVKIGPNSKISKDINIPYTWQTGKYKIQVSATVDNITVSNENYFILKDRPILNIGGGYLTYGDIIGRVGWLVLACLIFLLFFALLAIWEHRLTRRAIIQVTEKILRRKGFVG